MIEKQKIQSKVIAFFFILLCSQANSQPKLNGDSLSRIIKEESISNFNDKRGAKQKETIKESLLTEKNSIVIIDGKISYYNSRRYKSLTKEKIASRKLIIDPDSETPIRYVIIIETNSEP